MKGEGVWGREKMCVDRNGKKKGGKACHRQMAPPSKARSRGN